MKSTHSHPTSAVRICRCRWSGWRHWRKHALLRIGLSATQKPIEDVARFLVGADPNAKCKIIDTGHVRRRDLTLELPPSPLEAVMSHEVWEQIYEKLTALIDTHRTT
jgi:ATP-dependent Lhr-like helicase